MRYTEDAQIAAFKNLGLPLRFGDRGDPCNQIES
jgi:hypothetical protein